MSDGVSDIIYGDSIPDEPLPKDKEVEYFGAPLPAEIVDEQVVAQVMQRYQEFRRRRLESNEFPTHILQLPVELHKDILDYLWANLDIATRDQLLVFLEHWCAIKLAATEWKGS